MGKSTILNIAAAITAICAILLPVCLLSVAPVTAWWISTHSDLADDALQGLALSSSDINAIAGYAEDPDLELPDPDSSCHRVEKYQLVYAQYGGDVCAHPGAEWWARDFVSSARANYLSGNTAQWRHDLGFALHYIEDSACPAHVFPFRYAILSSPHWNFESNVSSDYGGNTAWSNAVTNAPAKLILHDRHLAQAVEAEADCVNTLACSYIRADGALIGDPSPPQNPGYLMSDDMIGISMTRAAGIIRGTAVYTRTADAALPSTAIAVDAPDGYERWAAGKTCNIRWAYCGSPGGYVRIDLFKDGSYCLAIAENVSISARTGEQVGSYTWTIPYTLPPGGGYTLKISSAADPALYDTCDNAFSILPPADMGIFSRVGVGMDPPQKILHVTGSGAGSIPLFQRGTDSAGFIIERTTTNRWLFGVNESPTLGYGFVISTIPQGTTSVPRLVISPSGNVTIPGAISAGAKNFRIDHPLHPAGSYLLHSFVESPDMLNVYSGNVVLDANGEVVIELPAYFSALNRDYSYQLDAVGEFAPLYVKREISDNKFTIAGGKPGLKVSWQITGIRSDPYATSHPITVEQEKPVSERGFYLHPAECLQPSGYMIK